MSVWIFPALQEAFEEEGRASPPNLYKNVCNTLNLANQRANTHYQTAEAIKADHAVARQLLTEATQRLQEAQANAHKYPNRYRNSPSAPTTLFNH
jgi:hypothetical protein